LEEEILRILTNKVAALNRPDLFREPIASFSSAKDSRYDELKEIIGEWHLSPCELLPDANSVISYFVPFTRSIVNDPLNAGVDGSPLWGEAYEVLNRYINHINEAISDYLISLGFSAKPLPATHTYDPKDMKCFFSHRSAAHIANLGAFGANRLLITEKGSGGRYCTIFTSAPLKASRDLPTIKCLYKENGTCGLCIKICPVSALSFDDIDRFVCNEELVKNGEVLKRDAGLENSDVCGKCISVCPLVYME